MNQQRTSKVGFRSLILIPICCIGLNARAALHHSLSCDSQGNLKNYRVTGETPAAVQGDQIVLNDPIDSYYSNRNGTYLVSKIKYIIDLAVRNGSDPYYALALAMVENSSALTSHPDQLNVTEGQANMPVENHETIHGTIPLDGIATLDAFKCKIEEIPMSERANNRVAHYLLKDFKGNELLYQQVQGLDKDKKHSRDLDKLKNQKEEILKKMLKNAESTFSAEEKSFTNLNYRKYSVAKMTCSTDMSPSPSVCRALVLPQEAIPTFKIGEGPAREVCQASTLFTAGSAGNFSTPGALKDISGEPESLAAAKGCCAQVKSPESISDENLMTALLGIMGLDFMKSKIQTGLRVAQNMLIKSPMHKMSVVLQAFNGFGRIGTYGGESANNCIDGLNLKQHPVYGSGTGELVLNMFMAQPLIRQMVTEATKSSLTKSVFCEVLGSGNHEFDGAQFAKIQERSFAGRGCPKHSYGYKSASQHNLPTPSAH